MAKVRVGEFFKALFESVQRDFIFDIAAQQAYWALLSLFPFAIFVLTLIGYIPMHGLDREVLGVAHRLMPEMAAALFESTVAEVVGKQRGWLLLISLLLALWSASAWMSGNITALNRAYRAKSARPFWKAKLLSLAITLGSAALIIISTVLLLTGPDLAHSVAAWFGVAGPVDAAWKIFRWPVSVAALMMAFAVLYWMLPNVRHPFRLFSPGAIVGILLWIAISMLFKIYAAHVSSYTQTYGTLGAAVVLMTWLYLSCLAVLLGGEINGVLECMRQPPEERTDDHLRERPKESPER